MGGSGSSFHIAEQLMFTNTELMGQGTGETELNVYRGKSLFNCSKHKMRQRLIRPAVQEKQQETAPC